MNVSNKTEVLNVDLNESSNDTINDVYAFYVVDRTYLMIPICTIGVIFNILNIIVFTRKRMRSSINFLLTCLAISDMTAIFFEIGVPMIIHAVMPPEVPTGKSTYGLAVISLMDYYVARWFYNVSNWMTVTVGIWRCVAVTWPLRAQMWCTVTRAKLAVAIVVIVNAILAGPESTFHGLRSVSGLNVSSSVQIYERYYNPFVTANSFFVLQTTRYVIVLMRIIPSLILVFLTVVLIRTLYHASAIRRQLSKETADKSSQKSDRTTPMLLVVVIIFLISSLPYSVVLILLIAFGNRLDKHIKDLLAYSTDYLQIGVVLNYTVNFCIYCVMSRKFRRTFLGIFCSKICTIFPKKNLHTQASSSSAYTIDTSTDENGLKLHNLSAGTSEVRL